MKSRIHARTDVGAVRAHNEDAFWFDAGLGAAIVSDGMGGHAAGEVASALAVRAFERVVKTGLSRARTLNQVKEILSESIRSGNREVRQTVEREPSRYGMGATVVCACLWRDVLVIAHVGDSRAYLIDRTRSTQLTRDHSYVQELVDRGVIGPEEARTHPERNKITRSVGGDEDIRVDICAVEAEPGDRLLLCSDGLVGVVSDEDIFRTVRSRSLPAACEALIRRAMEGGAPDNVTVLVMEIGAGGRSAGGAWMAGAAALVLVGALLVLRNPSLSPDSRRPAETIGGPAAPSDTSSSSSPLSIPLPVDTLSGERLRPGGPAAPSDTSSPSSPLSIPLPVDTLSGEREGAAVDSGGVETRQEKD